MLIINSYKIYLSFIITLSLSVYHNDSIKYYIINSNQVIRDVSESHHVPQIIGIFNPVSSALF